MSKAFRADFEEESTPSGWDNGRDPNTGYIIRKEGVLIVWKQLKAQEASPQAKLIANISLVLRSKTLDSYFYYPLPNHVIIFFCSTEWAEEDYFSSLYFSDQPLFLEQNDNIYLWINNWLNHKNALGMLTLFLFSCMMGNERKKEWAELDRSVSGIGSSNNFMSW